MINLYNTEPEVTSIFLVGPSSSGKTYGFDTVFLPTIQKIIKGNIYKIDGGIMRDESCIIKNRLNEDDVSLSKLNEDIIKKRGNIYKTVFKNTKKTMTNKILPKKFKPSDLIKYSQNNCQNNNDNEDNCDTWLKNNKINSMKKESETERYKKKIICKSLNNGDVSGKRRIGIVFVETYTKIMVKGWLLRNLINNIDKEIKKKNKQLNNIKSIFCWNNAPKLYCEISGYSRGIIDGKKYEVGGRKTPHIPQSYDLILNGMFKYFKNKINWQLKRGEYKHARTWKTYEFYIHYNTWEENQIIDYEWLNNQFFNEQKNTITDKYNLININISKLKEQIKSWNNSTYTHRLQPDNTLRQLNEIKEGIDKINNLIEKYLTYISENKNIKYTTLIQLIKDNKLLRDLSNMNHKTEFELWMEEHSKYWSYKGQHTYKFNAPKLEKGIVININVLELGWEKNGDGWKNNLRNIIINKDGTINSTVSLKINNNQTLEDFVNAYVAQINKIFNNLHQ